MAFLTKVVGPRSAVNEKWASETLDRRSQGKFGWARLSVGDVKASARLKDEIEALDLVRPIRAISIMEDRCQHSQLFSQVWNKSMHEFQPRTYNYSVSTPPCTQG